MQLGHRPQSYCMQVSFLGHSAPGASSKVQRGGSGEHTNGCRSFIFGNREDSNTEALPAQQPVEVCKFDPEHDPQRGFDLSSTVILQVHHSQQTALSSLLWVCSVHRT